MRALSLNFSRQQLRKQRRRDLIVLVLSAVLIAIVVSEISQLQRQHQQVETTVERRSPVKQTHIETLLSDPRQQRELQAMVQSLNLPWYELLSALEQIKQQHPEVFLVAISPDVVNKQIMLRGETKTLDNLLVFIDSLNQNAVFRSALPLNQQQVIPSTEGMQFTLKLEWRHG